MHEHIELVIPLEADEGAQGSPGVRLVEPVLRLAFQSIPLRPNSPDVSEIWLRAGDELVRGLVPLINRAPVADVHSRLDQFGPQAPIQVLRCLDHSPDRGDQRLIQSFSRPILFRGPPCSGFPGHAVFFSPVYKAIALKFIIRADAVDTEFGSFVPEPEILKFGEVFIPRLHHRDT